MDSAPQELEKPEIKMEKNKPGNSNLNYNFVDSTIALQYTRGKIW